MTRRELYNLMEPDRFSRSWWMARLRGGAWVVLVTTFLWIWADVEFTDETEMSATVELVTAPSSKLVLLSKSRVRVTFQVQGRQRSLEQLKHSLQSPETVVKYVVSEDEKDLSVRDILNRDKMIVAEGLSVLSTSPSNLRVRLDTKIYQPDIPVRFDYTGALSPEVSIDPPKMGIHVARSDWQNIVRLEPRPVLKTKQVDLKSVVDPSKPFEVDVIPQIAGLGVEPDQSTVRVTVKIVTLTETQDITVPVQVLQPPAWLEDDTWEEYSLSRKSIPEWRVTLQLSGPRADLDKLKAENVRAYIILTDEDKKPVSWLTRPVDVQLPADLSLRLFAAPPTVTFKLEKKVLVGTLP